MTSATGTVAVPRAPREVLCVTEHEHRDRAVAEAAIAGRFTVAGQTLDRGLEPDWTGGLPADDEWRIEWVKFAWGLDLATTYAETGDARCLDAWERLVASWLRQVPPSADASEVTARRLLNWIYAWQRFASAPAFPGLSGELAAALVESVGEQAAHVRATLAPERNHRTLELYALFVVALALPELDPGDLRAFAIAELDRNLREDFRPDGVHREASTHYHLIALRSLVGARENARRHGVRLPHGFDDRLARACAFALHCRRPDGLIPALSDADTGDYAPLLALAGDLLEDDELRWAGSSGRRGRLPARRHASFPDGGYHVQRSGWRRGTAERFLIFDCGPLGDGGHGHYDLLAVEAFGGRPLLVDPGRFTYSEEPPNLRRWFKGTAAHNTVCVDGLDQTPYRRTRPAGQIARGRLLGRGTAPGLDLLAGEAVSPAYDAVHQRRVAFVGDAYWIIEDRLWAPTPHRYDLRFHLAPEAFGRTVLRRGDGHDAVIAPGMALVIAAATHARLEPGWISPEYGVRHEAPVVSAALDGRRVARFVTVLAPLAPGRAAPVVTRLDDDCDTTVVRVAGLDPAGSADTITLRPGSCRWRRTSSDGVRRSVRTVELESGGEAA